MTDFDAIVVGAGHNGLTAAALLQKAGLRTLCLDFKLYAGGMASTVELFDGYKFEIAGSLQIPTSAIVSRELGLDALPTVDLDVMSVSLRGVGDEPLIYYTDPMKLLTHINEVHGAEAVNGMAGLMAWCQAPTRALGRFDAGQPPKTLDEMYACATNEFERSTITDLLFGSVTDVIDRYLPDTFPWYWKLAPSIVGRIVFEPWWRRRRTALFSEYDAIVCAPGPYLADYDPRATSALADIAIAADMGLRVVLASHSIGPLSAGGRAVIARRPRKPTKRPAAIRTRTSQSRNQPGRVFEAAAAREIERVKRGLTQRV